MGRAKEFNPDAAVLKALDLFWERGYEATSIQDLVDRTGVQRGSLYSAFGSKHGLYLAAIDAYCKQQFQLDPTEGLKGIQRLFERIAAEACSDCRGCFILNAGIELSDSDALVREKFRMVVEAMEHSILAALQTAQQNGEIANRPLVPLARLLVSAALGLRAMAKARPPKSVIDDVVQTALTAIR